MEIFIAGTGSFAVEIADWAQAAGYRIAGLVELFDDSRIATTRHGFEVSGPEVVPAGAQVVLGFGGSRRAGWERLDACGWSARALVHPSAVLAADVRVEDGATIGPLAVVGTASVIGGNALVSRGALVGHHVDVGAFSVLNPGANIGGNTTIGEDVFVGIGATVVNGRTIGDGAVIAAGRSSSTTSIRAPASRASPRDPSRSAWRETSAVASPPPSGVASTDRTPRSIESTAASTRSQSRLADLEQEMVDGSRASALARETHELLSGELRAILHALVAEEPANRRRLHRLRESRGLRRRLDDAAPLVTVTVATRARARLLAERSLPSILGQTYDNLEVIVVGDDADEATADAVSSLGDPRVTYRNPRSASSSPPTPTATGSSPPPWRATRPCGSRPDAGSSASTTTTRWRRPASNGCSPGRGRSGFEAVYGRTTIHAKGQPDVVIGAFPPRLGEFTWASGMYHAGLRFFARELVAADLGLPGDWYLAAAHAPRRRSLRERRRDPRRDLPVSRQRPRAHGLTQSSSRGCGRGGAVVRGC